MSYVYILKQPHVDDGNCMVVDSCSVILLECAGEIC